MSRIKVYFPSNAQGLVQSRPLNPHLPAGSVGSTKTLYQLQAVSLDGTAIDITGWTLAGTILRKKTRVVSAVGGLALDASADNTAIGYFEWTPSSANLTTADTMPGYEVQFTITSTTDLVSVPMSWVVYPKNTV